MNTSYSSCSIKPLLEKEGFILEIKDFTDYIQPNMALAEKSLNANFFQHIPYLENMNKEKNLGLVWVAKVHIEPLGIYSKKITKLEELKSGDSVAIPNDPTNGGRALILLQSAGLLKIDEAAGILPTLKDVVENPLELELVEVDASTTARVQEDVTVSVINSGFAVDAGLNPAKDAIFLEPVDDKSKPYINVIAVRTEDKDNKALKRIVELYQTEAVRAIINELYKGSQVTPW